MARASVHIESHVFEALNNFLKSGKVPKDDFGRPIYKNKADLATKAVQELLRKHRKKEVEEK